jgi:uncharacterized phage-associated protein
VSAKAVANEFLDLAERDGAKIDPLQLQKLLYLAQGWTLALTGNPLFPDHIEAWDYGPVVPEVYHSLKAFGSSPIRGRLRSFDFIRGELTVAQQEFDDVHARIIKNVWEKYGSWSGPELIYLTHAPGGPWHETRREHPGENDARINRGKITSWFEKEANEARGINDPEYRLDYDQR